MWRFTWTRPFWCPIRFLLVPLVALTCLKDRCVWHGWQGDNVTLLVTDLSPFRHRFGSFGRESSQSGSTFREFGGCYNILLLMEEILQHLGCKKTCKRWDKLPISWCRISAINSSIVHPDEWRSIIIVVMCPHTDCSLLNHLLETPYRIVVGRQSFAFGTASFRVQAVRFREGTIPKNWEVHTWILVPHSFGQLLPLYCMHTYII